MCRAMVERVFAIQAVLKLDFVTLIQNPHDVHCIMNSKWEGISHLQDPRGIFSSSPIALDPNVHVLNNNDPRMERGVMALTTELCEENVSCIVMRLKWFAASKLWRFINLTRGTAAKRQIYNLNLIQRSFSDSPKKGNVFSLDKLCTHLRGCYLET